MKSDGFCQDGEPYNLYKKHGTCLRGLEKEGIPVRFYINLY